jgi:ParB family chromosome partitioning protein
VSHDEPKNLDDSLQHFPLDIIQPGVYQPRVDMSQESLDELAESIRAQGLVQPIVVRPVGSGRYEIIAGERRWRASKLAELELIPAIVRDVSDRSAIAMALIENIQRENLNPMEEANALFRLKEEFSMTHQEAAEAVGRSRTAVSNLLRLRNLNDDVKKLVENCDLEMGHARALLALDGELQSETAKTVVEKDLSVRETEQLIRRIQKPVKKPNDDADNEEIRTLEQTLQTVIGQKVTIKQAKNGKGKIVIDFNNVEMLRNLTRKLT